MSGEQSQAKGKRRLFTLEQKKQMLEEAESNLYKPLKIIKI